MTNKIARDAKEKRHAACSVFKCGATFVATQQTKTKKEINDAAVVRKGQEKVRVRRQKHHGKKNKL
jgi:hypothetical protein